MREFIGEADAAAAVAVVELVGDIGLVERHVVEYARRNLPCDLVFGVEVDGCDERAFGGRVELLVYLAQKTDIVADTQVGAQHHVAADAAFARPARINLEADVLDAVSRPDNPFLGAHLGNLVVDEAQAYLPALTVFEIERKVVHKRHVELDKGRELFAEHDAVHDIARAEIAAGVDVLHKILRVPIQQVVGIGAHGIRR